VLIEYMQLVYIFVKPLYLFCVVPWVVKVLALFDGCKLLGRKVTGTFIINHNSQRKQAVELEFVSPRLI